MRQINAQEIIIAEVTEMGNRVDKANQGIAAATTENSGGSNTRATEGQVPVSYT